MIEKKISVAGICEQNGRFFIGQRLPGGDLGNKWEFPGGKIEEGETPENSLIREFSEEFNIPIKVGTFLCEVEFCHHDFIYRLLAYKVEFLSVSIVLAEHVQTHWASIEEIENLDFADSDRKILAFLMKK